MRSGSLRRRRLRRRGPPRPRPRAGPAAGVADGGSGGDGGGHGSSLGGVGGLVPRLQRGGGASQRRRRLVAGRSQALPVRCPRWSWRSGGRSLSVVAVGARAARRWCTAATPVQLGGPQQRRVLAVLAVHANEVVSSDRLIDVLWGEVPPASASHTLQTLVSRLRGGLGADRVETVAPGYRLRVERRRGRQPAVRGVGAGRPRVGGSA